MPSAPPSWFVKIQILLSITDMEPINPLGFPAPFAPSLIWIFSVINKCKFRCACILKSTFQQCYGILRVSLSSKQIFFFNLYLLYLNHACLSNILFCMGSNYDYFDFDLTLTWLHADGVPRARACHDSINDFAFQLECAVLLIERKYTIGSCWSGSLVFCWFLLISIWWQRKLRFMQVSVETWPSSTLQRDSTWLNLPSGRSGSCDFYVFGPLRSWTRMTRTSKLQVCCTQWDQNRSTSWNTSLIMMVRNLTKWL